MLKQVSKKTRSLYRGSMTILIFSASLQTILSQMKIPMFYT